MKLISLRDGLPCQRSGADGKPIAQRFDEAAKRIFDAVVAGSAIVACAPLLLTVAAAIAIDSPGPAIFRSRRVGRYGIPFTVFKFRSMYVDSGSVDRSVGKNDPRVTRVGKIIRRLKVDELPQLWNVLLGDMSLVGPRPEMLRYADTLKGEYASVLEVRPGLTDRASLRFMHVDEVLGQVNADHVYEERVLPEKNRLRLEYVRTRTFWGDIRIIFATVGKLIVSLLGRLLRWQESQ